MDYVLASLPILNSYILSCAVMILVSAVKSAYIPLVPRSVVEVSCAIFHYNWKIPLRFFWRRYRSPNSFGYRLPKCRSLVRRLPHRCLRCSRKGRIALLGAFWGENDCACLLWNELLCHLRVKGSSCPFYQLWKIILINIKRNFYNPFIIIYFIQIIFYIKFQK